METNELRKKFLEYFSNKNHLVVPSASLVPSGDPTLLFTSAGMVPFKQYFTGESIPPHSRLTSCQKSFRTPDIEEVGDEGHLTFFEMLGNFSFGDYFKKEAIEFAWEFVTNIINLPKNKLYVTIYDDDQDAYDIWKNKIGIPENRLFFCDKKDNWWGPAGNEGPCGPCSELHFDWGEEYGCGKKIYFSKKNLSEFCHPNCEKCSRFEEIWNLVFMEFYQDEMKNLSPLKNPCIDTGMGLERVAAILQNKRSIYNIDSFIPIIEKICEAAKIPYEPNNLSVRIIAEHIRASSFLIADGVVPSNEGRGYVLRRLLRRSVRFSRNINKNNPIKLTDIGSVILIIFKNSYPTLYTEKSFILRTIESEENKFGQTFERGNLLLKTMTNFRKITSENALKKKLPANKLVKSIIDIGNSILKEFTSQNSDQRKGIELSIAGFKEYNNLQSINQNITKDIFDNWVKTITGTEAFFLHDTYGFPIELTEEITNNNGFDIDLEKFNTLLDQQKDQARHSSKFSGSMEVSFSYKSLESQQLKFIGHNTTKTITKIAGIFTNNKPITEAIEGNKIEIILESTPFYPEGGGQVGDQGSIISKDSKLQVTDTIMPEAGIIIQKALVKKGIIQLHSEVEAIVNQDHRKKTSRNHTATHLLHASLRTVLGTHVKQGGSLITPNRIRFDFTHNNQISTEETKEIQNMINSKIIGNLNIQKTISTYVKAIDAGALAFFGDKYGEEIRIVKIGLGGNEFSHEVCGGTHVNMTGEIGCLFITNEYSIGAGNRRIEAITGSDTIELMNIYQQKISQIAKNLNVPINNLEERLSTILSEQKNTQKQIDSLKTKNLIATAQKIANTSITIKNIKFMSTVLQSITVEDIRKIGDWIRNNIQRSISILGTQDKKKSLVIIMISKELVIEGMDAGKFAKWLAQKLDGGGGGKQDIAQAGGKNIRNLEEVLSKAKNIVTEQLRT